MRNLSWPQSGRSNHVFPGMWPGRLHKAVPARRWVARARVPWVLRPSLRTCGAACSSETRARTRFFLSQRLLQLQSAEAMVTITYIGLVAALIACTPLTAAFAPTVSLSGWRVARTGRCVLPR